MNTQWDNLMDESIEICSKREAKHYFKSVERLAKVLDLVCNNGKEFYANEAYNIWCRTEDDVDKSISELRRTCGGDVYDFPEVGLKYFWLNNILAVGVYDRGNFDAVAEWEFRPSIPEGIKHDRFPKNPFNDESTIV